MRIRAALLLGMLALTGCAAVPGLVGGEASAGVDMAAPFPECQVEHYAFAGRATLTELGLVGEFVASRADPDQPGMMWVTRDPVLFDAAQPPGGSRMLCFELDDRQVGSSPVKAAWQPPGVAAAQAAASAEINWTIPLLVMGVGTVLAVGGYAFRRR